MRNLMIRVAVGVMVASAVVLGPATPASANVNFDGHCETTEACGYRLGREYAWNGYYGIYDYEGRDNYLNDNWYKAGRDAYEVNVDNSLTSYYNRGVSCHAVFWNGFNGTGDEQVLVKIGNRRDVNGTVYDNSSSSLVWRC